MDPNNYPNEDPKTTEPFCQTQRGGECNLPSYWRGGGDWKILEREDDLCLVAAPLQPEQRLRLANRTIETVKQVDASTVSRVCDKDPWDRGKLLCDPLPGESGAPPRGPFIGNPPPTVAIPTGCSRYGRNEMICQGTPSQGAPFQIPNGTYDASARPGAREQNVGRRAVRVQNNVLFTSDVGTYRFRFLRPVQDGSEYLITDKRTSGGGWQSLPTPMRMLVVRNTNWEAYTVWFGNGQNGYSTLPTEYWFPRQSN